MTTNLQQRILEVFRKFGEPATRAEARQMLEDPAVTPTDFGSRVSNLLKHGHIEAITSKDGITRYQFAGDASRKGRKSKAPEPAAAAPAEKPKRGRPPGNKRSKRVAERANAELVTTGDRIEADAFNLYTSKLPRTAINLDANTARELAVVALSHPRPLSDNVRAAVIELVRIAA